MASEHGKEQVLGVSEFKRRCLELIEQTRTRGDEIVITKRGQPVARVVPIRDGASSLRGLLRGRGRIVGDIVEVDWSDDWDATS